MQLGFFSIVIGIRTIDFGMILMAFTVTGFFGYPGVVLHYVRRWFGIGGLRLPFRGFHRVGWYAVTLEELVVDLEFLFDLVHVAGSESLSQPPAMDTC